MYGVVHSVHYIDFEIQFHKSRFRSFGLSGKHREVMLVPVISVTIGSDNGLAPNRCQAITCINDDLWSIESLSTKLHWSLINAYFFPKDIAFKIVVHKTSDILSRGQSAELHNGEIH